MTDTLHAQVVAHFQSWSALPKQKRSKSLRMHIVKHDKQLLAQLRRTPTVISDLSKRIQAAWLGKRFKTLRYEQLEPFMPLITATYIRLGEGMFLEEWINTALLEQCTTITQLEAFLKQHN